MFLIIALRICTARIQRLTAKRLESYDFNSTKGLSIYLGPLENFQEYILGGELPLALDCKVLW